MATEPQHFSDLSDSDNESNIPSDSDNESNPPSPVVAKKRKKPDSDDVKDAPESGDKSLFSSADDTTDTVLSGEQVRAITWANWDKLCDFKDGELYFPKGEDGKSREFWEDRTIEYEPDVKRDDIEENSDTESINGDELVAMIKEGADNLKRPENKKIILNVGKVGRPREGIDKLAKYKSS
eukprot:6721509-Prymnesium_polylepis.1